MSTYDIALAAFFIVIIIGIFMGAGENRSIIVFRDYDDLGLTFLIPASFVLIYYLFAQMGGNPQVGAIVGAGVAFLLFLRLLVNTFVDNSRNVFKTLLALIVKMPLAIIWIFNLLQLLNPQGTGTRRRQNRGQALIILTLLTPILGMLVADKSGSFFSPKSWLKGRRGVSTIRNSL